MMIKYYNSYSMILLLLLISIYFQSLVIGQGTGPVIDYKINEDPKYLGYLDDSYLNSGDGFTYMTSTRHQRRFFTKWILSSDGQYPNYTVNFNCYAITNKETRYCSHNSTDQFKNFISSPLYSEYCFMQYDPIWMEVCLPFTDFEFALPFATLSLDSKPSTLGEKVKVRGRFLRLNYEITGGYLNMKIQKDNEDFKFVSISRYLDQFPNEFYINFPAGTGTSKIIYGAGPNSTVRYSMWTYVEPIITSVTANPNTLTIYGTNFGTNSSLVSTTEHGLDLVNKYISFINHSRIEFKLPSWSYPVGGLLDISISVDGVRIKQSYSQCIQPNITEASSVSSALGGIVTIKGSYFVFVADAYIVIGGNKCTNINLISDTQITCKLPATSLGHLNSLPIQFWSNTCNSANKFKESDPIFTYDIPVVSNGGITQNGNDFTFIGSNFRSNAKIYIKGLTGTITPIVNSNGTSLSFKLPNYKCTPTIELTLSFDGVFGNYSIPSQFSLNFTSTQIHKFYFDNSIDFKLQNIICDYVSLPKVTIKGDNTIYNCSAAIEFDDYVTINCKLPKSTSTELRIFTIKYGGYSSTTTELTPQLPTFKSISNGKLSTTDDGKVITITGTNFGSLNTFVATPPYTIIVKINDIERNINITDDNTLYASVPYSSISPISSTSKLDVRVYFRNLTVPTLNQTIEFKESEIINVTSISNTGGKQFIIYGNNIKIDFKVSIPQFEDVIPCQLIKRNLTASLDCDLLICTPPDVVKTIDVINSKLTIYFGNIQSIKSPIIYVDSEKVTQIPSIPSLTTPPPTTTQPPVTSNTQPTTQPPVTSKPTISPESNQGTTINSITNYLLLLSLSVIIVFF